MKVERLEIKKIDINGYGISYYRKKIVFVPYALPGEIVEVEFVKEESNYINAKLIKVIKMAKERVKPACPVFKKCGGCSLMHLNYEAQLKYKQETLKETLLKYTGLNVDVLPTIGCENIYHYRNKVSLAVKKVDNRIILGLYEQNSHYIVDYSSCLVQDEVINETLIKIREALENSKVYIGEDGLKFIVLRKSNVSDECQLTLVLGRQRKLDYLVELLSKINNIKAIYMNINERTKGQVLGTKTTKLYGTSNTIKNQIGDKVFKLAPTDFFQLNSKQTKVLYDVVKEYAAGSERIVDCYAGVGTIGQYLTDKNLRGIEINPSAVKSANENCKINHVGSDLPKAYHVGETGEVLKRWCKDGYKPDLMIFDPPRVGLDEDSINTIIKVRPKKVIYVSCNPSTLAKDLNLIKKYYKIEKCQPVDMFSNTEHVESVTLLTKI